VGNLLCVGKTLEQAPSSVQSPSQLGVWISRMVPMLRFWSPLLLVLCLIPVAVSAQDVPTVSKASDIAVFGGYLNANPAFTSYPNERSNGILFGADFTRYFHLPVAPSFEVRANLANGSYVNEHSYLGGLRVQGDIFHHLHPYGDFLAGYGSIFYDHPSTPSYTHDNSLVYSYGGGVDFDVTRNFQGMVDFQGQSWNIGKSAGDKFSPSIFSVGVRYVIPFKPHVSARYNHN